MIIIPGVVILVSFTRRITNVFTKFPVKSQYSTFISVLTIVNTINAIIYFMVLEFARNAETSYLVIVILPRISYACFISSAFLVLCILRNSLPTHQKIHLFLIAIVPSVLLIIGKNALFVFVMFMVIILSFLKFTKLLNFRENFSTYSTVNLVACHFYFITGHRNSLDSIQITAGFVGIEKSNVLISGLLIGINTFAPYLILFLLMFYKMTRYQSKSYLNKLSKNYDLTIKFLYLCGFYLWSLFGTAIHCSYNTEALLLVYEFMPKFLLDASTYLVVNLFLFVMHFVLFYW